MYELSDDEKYFIDKLPHSLITTPGAEVRSKIYSVGHRNIRSFEANLWLLPGSINSYQQRARAHVCEFMGWENDTDYELSKEEIERVRVEENADRRPEIKNMIRERGYTFRELEKRMRLPTNAISVAVRVGNERTEAHIARFLGFEPQDLWTDRYTERKELLTKDIENAKRNVAHDVFPFSSGEGWPDQSIIDKILSLGKPLRTVEAENGLRAGSIRQTIKNRNIRVDRIISELIGVNLQELWPYRYVPDETRAGCYKPVKTSDFRSVRAAHLLKIGIGRDEVNDPLINLKKPKVSLPPGITDQSTKRS